MSRHFQIVALVALLALLHAPLAALSHTVIFYTTSTVRSYTVGTGCSGNAQTTYYALNTNACTSEQGTNSMRVTCGAGIAPRLEIFANNASCAAGTATTIVNGSVAVPYVPTAESVCMSGTDFDYTIQCEEVQIPQARQIAYTDSTCTQRQSLQYDPDTVGSTLGQCLSSGASSYASYLATANNRYFQYYFAGQNCAVENYTSITTISAGHCVQDIYSPPSPAASTARRLLQSTATTTTTYFMITAAANATFRGPAPPTAWPPAADNTLMYDYACSDANCGVQCRVTGATRLGFCQYTAGSMPYATSLCSADTQTYASLSFASASCSASSLFSVNVNPAGNKCAEGTFKNCGNGLGVAPALRLPTSYLDAASFVAIQRNDSCTGSGYDDAVFQLANRCLPQLDGTYVQALLNTTSNIAELVFYNAATNGSQQCQDADITHPQPSPLGQCSGGFTVATVAQALALGFSINTTAISNGVNGNGQVVVVPVSSSSSSSTGGAAAGSTSSAASTGAAASTGGSPAATSTGSNGTPGSASTVAVSIGALFAAALVSIFAQRA